MAAILVLGACSQGDGPAPSIASVSPSHASPGLTILIGGSSFCQQPEDPDDPLACLHTGDVFFGVTIGTITLYSDVSIMVEVPDAAGSVGLVVSSNGRGSNVFDFVIDSK